jgi:hypothetical protein
MFSTHATAEAYNCTKQVENIDRTYAIGYSEESKTYLQYGQYSLVDNTNKIYNSKETYIGHLKYITDISD